jgi:catechol 2,3-dioxygenase-like lactoylglutathione lyase family enzyme
MRFLSVTLHAPAGRLLELAGFYGRLGLEVQSDGERAISFRAGETELELVSSDGEPFYHFALLVPGNRFEAAYAAAGSVAELLPERETGDTVFDSDNWSSLACYFHDPAGNIVELIAHRGLLETAVDGEFGAAELIGLSELGLVGDRPVMAAGLAGVLGLELWDGTLAEPTRLAFVGERARTLILAPPGRGWVPTGRAAEAHPVDAVLAGRRDAQLELAEGDVRYRLRSVSE